MDKLTLLTSLNVKWASRNFILSCWYFFNGGLPDTGPGWYTIDEMGVTKCVISTSEGFRWDYCELCIKYHTSLLLCDQRDLLVPIHILIHITIPKFCEFYCLMCLLLWLQGNIMLYWMIWKKKKKCN